MFWYILPQKIVSVFLSMSLLTTLSFDSEVTSFMYGGKRSEVQFDLVGNKKTLVMKATQKENLSNLLVVTKNRKFYFSLKYDDKKPHQFIEVRDGIINHNFKLLMEFNQKNIKFNILEGEHSMMIQNLSELPIVINEEVVKDKDYFSKGIPLFLKTNNATDRILN